MGDDDLHLSRIDTLWSVVRQAHEGEEGTVRSAQQVLLDRYGGAIRRYLLAALRDEDAADEVFQEFSLKFVSGAFAQANPDRGRFRNFVKSSVYRMIVDYRRRQKRDARQQPLPPGGIGVDASEEQESVDDDEVFLQSWREELLARCWDSLQRLEENTNIPYYSVLRFRADHPHLKAPEIAEQLSRDWGQDLKAGNVRVMIHRAREKFSELLLDALQETLENPSLDELEQELIDLSLMDYCRPALARRRGSGVRSSGSDQDS